MEKRRTIQNLTIIVLGIAMIVMTVGYASYSSTLEIKGDAIVTAAKWDIHFANITTGKNATIGNTTSTPAVVNGLVTFNTTLNPGETYTFDVDVVNAGTFNAKLATITGSGYYADYDSNNIGEQAAQTPITVEQTLSDKTIFYQNDYLTYTVAYKDGTPLAINDSLPKLGETGSTKTLTVTVKYDTPEDATKLPAVNRRYHFELGLNYEQAA